MKKEIINIKVYITLLTLLYVGLFAYVIITNREITTEYVLIAPAVIFNIFLNIFVFTNEENGVKLTPILAGLTFTVGAATVNIICLVGSVVLFVGWFKYYKILGSDKKNTNIQPEPAIINENQYGNDLITEELPDMVVDGYITRVLFDPDYQGEQPYLIEIEYYLGEHIYTFEVGGFERDITIDLDVKNLRHIPVFLQHGSPDLAQIDEATLRHNLDN